MPSTKSAYDSTKVERLRNLLTDLHAKGKAKFFEIFVDKLKVVEKTDDPSEFDSYLEYMDDDTREIKVVIYNTGNSPRNDQYIFERKYEILQEKKQSEELGTVDIGKQMDEKLEAAKEKWEMERFREKHTELEKKLKDAEEYIEKLEIAYEEVKEKKQTIKGVDIGELTSVALEGLIRRNTHLISKIPGGEVLAGVIDEDTKERDKSLAAPQQETEASFKPSPAKMDFNEEDKERIEILKMMQQNFSESEAKQIWNILKKLSEDKTLIAPVSELIETK